MFLKFKKGEQRSIIMRAIDKAGSERMLAIKTKIPKGSIYALKTEKRNLSKNYAENICIYLGIGVEDLNYVKLLPNNWGQVKGGKKLIILKKQNGNFQETIDKLKKASSERMKKWHSQMKKNDPGKYHIWQYERFKKIGKGYCYSIKNGTKVRNLLEKQIGDFLIKNFKNVRYEPYLNIYGKAYFTDFMLKKIIIEVTEWKHPSKEKVLYLNRKIDDYLKAGYVTLFFIPEQYRKFYKQIRSPKFSTLSNLKKFINASVA